jgi:NAD(P)-dependent dehydrogenase (short-subunit alcohol dehydrogenase family)
MAKKVIIYTYLFAVFQEVSMTRVAIVTASDSGIGKTTALMLAERGFDIGVTWHSDEKGALETCREVEAQGQRAEAVHLDLSTLPEGAEALRR